MISPGQVNGFKKRFGFERRELCLANWRERPFSRYAFQHVNELVPSAFIPASGQRAVLSQAEGIEGLRLPVDGIETDIAGFLEQTETDALLVLRDGKPLIAWSAPACDLARPHIVFSVTKSLTGLLIARLEEEGLADPKATIADHLPSMKASAYGDATLRDVLDMRVSLDFEESYLDRHGDYARYRRAMLWNPPEEGTKAGGLEELLASLKKGKAPHGGPFHYQSPNSDLLGILAEHTSGMRWTDMLEEWVWKPMTMSGPAFLTVDALGAPRGAGGFSCTAMDLASIGTMLMNDGVHAGRRIIPAGWIADMRENGSGKAWNEGNFFDFLPGGRYRSQWYGLGGDWESFLAVGIHGQFLFVDPPTGTVAVKFGSQTLPQSDEMDAANIAFLKALTRLR